MTFVNYLVLALMEIKYISRWHHFIDGILEIDEIREKCVPEEAEKRGKTFFSTKSISKRTSLRQWWALCKRLLSEANDSFHKNTLYNMIEPQKTHSALNKKKTIKLQTRFFIRSISDMTTTRKTGKTEVFALQMVHRKWTLVDDSKSY